MIDYRHLFPPGPPPMYEVSQPLYLKAYKGKIYCKLSIFGDEEELCVLQPIAEDWRRLFSEIGHDIEGPGFCLLLDTLNYTLTLKGGFICPGFSRDKPSFIAQVKLPMGYPELIKMN